ncbi:methyl-accepting chemotaxis protein [Hydrogenophaga sp. RWCD_12]|uniref:methyl-accepting chemotaxis protein n=1 Tax=Hydrogenophaga sp. RWCD_12 TaxID=3391190 RepID=UPI003984FA96
MFKSLRLSILILGAIGVLAALGVALQGYWSQGRMSQSATEVFISKDVVADILPPPMYLIETRLVLSQAAEGTMQAEEAQRQFQRLKGEYEARAKHWQANPPYGLEQHLLGPQHAAAQRFLTAAEDKIIKPLLAGDRELARRNLPDVQLIYQEHRTGVDRTVAEGNKFAEASMVSFEAVHSLSMKVAAAMALSAVALVVLVYVLVLRSIDGPVRRCTLMAQRIAGGDLSTGTGVENDRVDVIGRLERALEEMRNHLSGVVRGVRESADAVATASSQIASGNLDLSRRTEQQAAALEETAASMEELGSNVQLNANNARQASQLADGASQVAARGGNVVEQVVTTMQGIQHSAQKIADISSMIDSIAFQTNILALNAAVEAARAGEQGRGFAVVAGEVRSLAQRSAEASREIKGLIGTSVDAATQGATLADHAGHTMQEIVASIRRVTEVVGEISLASGEQSTGVAQVGQAVVQIDQATQQNAALVEESAAAADSLKQQADRLVQAVSVFRLTA